jgi:hypothetical protein
MRLTKFESFMICLVATAIGALSLAYYTRDSVWQLHLVIFLLISETIFFFHYIPTKGKLLFFGNNTGVIWGEGPCFVFSIGTFLSFLTDDIRMPWDVINDEEGFLATASVVDIRHDYDQTRPSYVINTNATLLEMEGHRFISALLRFIFISRTSNKKFFNNGVGFRLIILTWVLAYASNNVESIQNITPPLTTPTQREVPTPQKQQQYDLPPQELQLIKTEQGGCLEIPAHGVALIEIDSLPISMDNVYNRLEIISNGTAYQSTWEYVQSQYPKDGNATIVLKTTATDRAGKICF